MSYAGRGIDASVLRALCPVSIRALYPERAPRHRGADELLGSQAARAQSGFAELARRASSSGN